MKHIRQFSAALGLFCAAQNVSAQATYTNYVRQVQYPSGVVWDTYVPPSGQQFSALAINPGGARFELWTVSSVGPVSTLLASNFVGTYIPVVTVAIRSEDTTSVIPRTRADRPFYVDYNVSGLLSGATDPDASKSVKFLRHVQSYGVGGDGLNIDRTQAILSSQKYITTNGARTLTFTLSSIPGADRSKIRGEERYSFFSLPDYQAPESLLASQFIQIWPVADGTITGITEGQLIRYALPPITLTLNDLYPNSTTYLQAYKGSQVLGTTGTVVPGSAVVINESAPKNRVLTLGNYDSAFPSDGIWTIELVTKTPFGLDRLAYVSFTLDRTIETNGSFTTIE